ELGVREVVVVAPLFLALALEPRGRRDGKHQLRYPREQRSDERALAGAGRAGDDDHGLWRHRRESLKGQGRVRRVTSTSTTVSWLSADAGKLPGKETYQLGALPIGETADGLRLADPAESEVALRLHLPELRHSHEHVQDLRSRHVLGWVAEDLVDLRLPELEVLLQLRPLDPDVVCP